MLHLECTADETTAVALGVPKRQIVHHPGKDEVFNYLKKETGLTAMIDEDPNSSQNPYFKSLAEKESKRKIRIFKDEQRDHTILVLCPELEPWIVNAAKTVKVDLQKFNLSKDPSLLHSELPRRKENLTKLLHELEERGCQDVADLRGLLSGL